jgi:hypothetical protein
MSAERLPSVVPVCAKMPTNVTPAPENGAPRSELQELQLKSGQVTDEVSMHSNMLLIKTSGLRAGSVGRIIWTKDVTKEVRNGSTVRQYISYSQASRKPMIQ